MTFEHRHSAHCESGVMSALLTHHGAPVSEALAFGLSAAISFAYMPFVKLSGLPLIAYRMPPRAIIKGLAAPYAARFRFETFRSPDEGQARLDALLEGGQLVGIQTSVFWLPYFPRDMRFHFNAHNLLVYGKEGDDYLISDPVFEHTVRCPSADLARARFAKGALAPKGLLYYPLSVGRSAATPEALRSAMRKSARIMLAPIPIVGVRGMRLLARQVERLAPEQAVTPAYVGHIVRMQEEIGTGGAGFRFLYAAFLQEAAEQTGLDVLREFSTRLTEIGDGWREFALRAARMIRAREPMAPQVLAQLLRQQADHEEDFFRNLKAAV